MEATRASIISPEDFSDHLEKDVGGMINAGVWTSQDTMAEQVEDVVTPDDFEVSEDLDVEGFSTDRLDSLVAPDRGLSDTTSMEGESLVAPDVVPPEDTDSEVSDASKIESWVEPDMDPPTNIET